MGGGQEDGRRTRGEEGDEEWEKREENATIMIDIMNTH